MPTVKWFACFSVETDVARSTRKEGSVAGVNVGLESFATLSEGEKVENPRFFKAEEKELAGVQRRLSKVPKGTPEREKALKVVERVQEKIANCILDFINKVSHALIDRFGVIAFEDLNIRDMLKNHNMAKSISDVAWGTLVTATKSKAACSGSEAVLVDPKPLGYVSGVVSWLRKNCRRGSITALNAGLSMDRDPTHP